MLEGEEMLYMALYSSLILYLHHICYSHSVPIANGYSFLCDNMISSLLLLSRFSHV